jgi:hypothetical protein
MRRRIQIITAAILAAALGCVMVVPAVHAQEARLLPVDEAASDPSWMTFKNRLITAASRHDRKFILSILDPNVRGGVESARGIPEFRKQWQLDSNTSPLWQELPAALFLGAAYVQHDKGPRELCAPYVGVRWPQDIDAFAGGALVAREVFVKSAPSSTSDTLATLSYHLVEVRDWEVADQSPGSRQKWVLIRIPKGEGYVPEEQIRSPIEHTACFVKGANGWRLTGFGPGGGK